MTPEAFLAWERANAELIQDVLAENQRRVDDQVIRFVMEALDQRATKEQAGDQALKTLLGTRGGTCFTREGIERSLRSIGWIPKRERGLAGGAHE